MSQDSTDALGGAIWNGMEAICKTTIDVSQFFLRKYTKEGVKANLNHFFENKGFIQYKNGKVTDKPHIARCYKTDYGYHMILRLYPGIWMGDLYRQVEVIESALGGEVYLSEDNSNWIHLRIYTRNIPKNFSYRADLAKRINKYPLAIPIGIGRAGFVQLKISDDETFSVLIAGMPGWGKSSFYRQALTAVATNYTPEEVIMFLIDMKNGVEFEPFQLAPHTLGWAGDLNGAHRVLIKALGELKYRAERIKKAGVSDITSFNLVKQGKEIIPRCIIAIDEWMSLDEKAKLVVQELAQKGRYAGIHLLICTQHPSAKVLAGEIKSLIPARLCFKVGSRLYSRMVLGEERNYAAFLNNKGRAILLTNDRLREVQVFNLTKPQATKLIRDRWPKSKGLSTVTLEPKVSKRKVASW